MKTIKPETAIEMSHFYSSHCVTRFHGSIIESVDSISRDEWDVPLTQYITNA